MREGRFFGFESDTLTVQVLTFNGNTGRFARVKLTFTFMKAGGIRIKHFINAFVLELYITPLHAFRGFMEAVFFLSYLLSLFDMCKELVRAYRKTGAILGYFHADPLNMVTFSSAGLVAANIVMWINIVIASNTLHVQERFDVYEDLQREANWLKLANNGEGLKA